MQIAVQIHCLPSSFFKLGLHGFQQIQYHFIAGSTSPTMRVIALGRVGWADWLLKLCRYARKTMGWGEDGDAKCRRKIIICIYSGLIVHRGETIEYLGEQSCMSLWRRVLVTWRRKTRNPIRLPRKGHRVSRSLVVCLSNIMPNALAGMGLCACRFCPRWYCLPVAAGSSVLCLWRGERRLLLLGQELCTPPHPSCCWTRATQALANM